MWCHCFFNLFKLSMRCIFTAFWVMNILNCHLIKTRCSFIRWLDLPEISHISPNIFTFDFLDIFFEFPMQCNWPHSNVCHANNHSNIEYLFHSYFFQHIVTILLLLITRLNANNHSGSVHQSSASSKKKEFFPWQIRIEIL